MVNSAVTTPSSFSSVLVLLISCCRVVTLRLQISGFPSVLCVVWVKQEQRGGIFFLDWEKKRNGVKLPSALFAMCWWHAWRTKDDVAAPPWSPLSFMPVWSGWICDISDDLKTPPQTSGRQRRLFVLMETNICWFWFCSCWTVSLARTASLSWEVEDVSLEYILLWKIIWKCQNTLLHSTLCFFSSKAFKWNCPAQLIIQKYSASGKKKRQHMQPFFHSFLIKPMLLWLERDKKNPNRSHWMEPKTFGGAGWEVKMGYLCPLWHHTGLLGQTSVLF